MAKKLKRLLSAALATILCVSCLVLPAHAEETGKTTFPINKTANGLDANDQTDVTLTVPGTVEGNIDVVFILGGGMTANMETIKSAINVFKPAMESGKATVRMGLISLEKGQEIILDLNSDEAVLDPDTYVDFVTEKFDSINHLPGGSTNLHSQLLEAQKMLAKETKAKAENKYVFVLATGRTYWFDDANGNQAMIIGKTDKLANGAGGTENFYYYGNYTWQSLRGKHSSLYMLPDKYNNDYSAFMADIEKWVEADGDKYVYSPLFDKNDYAAYENWYAKNSADWRDLYANGKGTRYGAVIIDPKPTTENFINGAVAGIPYGENNHAMNYERAQYESVQVWKELVAAGYNCYSICSEAANYQNGSENIKSKGYTGTSTIQVGHAFMDYLAELAGQGEAPVVWEYQRDENDKVVFYPGKEGNYNFAYETLRENFFDSVRDDMLYTTSIDSTVEDFIGKNENGNFEFIENADCIKLNVAGVDYVTAMTADTAEGSKYTFTAPSATEPTFWLDYYYGDGETTERFVWTFGENVSLERLASLTYKLQLTEKQEEAGEYTVPTNNSAILNPVDSDGKEGKPQVFPVPEVKYEVVPYDVDIVLALGAGIAQYDADSTKGTNTYDAIVTLVKPLVDTGINVKLGLVAVEHYDDVAMPLTVLTKDNYDDVITAGLNKIQSMPAGPTNLHGNIVAAKEMLDADTDVPAANKFFHVIATGRTYHYDNAAGVPTTIVNKIALKGNTYYYWGHYLWQSQRGRHTSLYMIPDCYNNSYEAFFKDIEKWVAADGDTYAYSFTDAYDVNEPQWFNTFYAANGKDAKALGLASSRFGWIMNPLTNSGHAGIGSGASPANALNYERAQYEAYQAYQAMKDAGYKCYALCSESTSYQNGSPYIQIAKYTGTSTIQLGHSFMNFLNGGEAPLLFVMTDPNTGASKMAENFFAAIDVDNLVQSTEEPEQTENVPVMMAPPMMSTGPKQPALEIVTQPEDAEGALGETVSVSVVAEGEGLKYQWYFRNAGAKAFSKSSIKTATYETEMNASRANREVYCVITDANGNSVQSDTVKLIRVVSTELKITEQPTDAAAAMGETAAVTVVAEGEGLKYQWYFRNAGAKSFSASSTRTATYEVEMDSSRVGRELYCVITDAVGNTLTTDVVKLIGIVQETLEIITQPVDAEGALGETVAVTVEAKGEGLKYQWYFRDAGATTFSKSSITAPTYSAEMTKARDGREMYCVITDAFGNSVQTNDITLTRVAAVELAITAQPVSASGALGEEVSVSVEAQGEDLTYRWYFRDAGKTSFSRSSITAPTYSVEMTKTRADRELYCVITDALGNSVQSDTVVLNAAEG